MIRHNIFFCLLEENLVKHRLISVVFIFSVFIILFTVIIPKILDVLDPWDQPRPDNFVLNLQFILHPRASFFKKYIYNVLGICCASLILVFLFSFFIIMYHHTYARLFILKSVTFWYSRLRDNLPINFIPLFRSILEKMENVNSSIFLNDIIQDFRTIIQIHSKTMA